MEAHRWGAAAALFRRVLAAVHPGDLTSQRGLARCLLDSKSHKYAEAAALLKSVCASPGVRPGDWLLLSEAQLGARQWDAALAAAVAASRAVQHNEQGIEMTERRGAEGVGLIFLLLRCGEPQGCLGGDRGSLAGADRQRRHDAGAAAD